MGCDIHMYTEYKKKGSKYWQSLGGRTNPGRNYFVFGLMAKGVRREVEKSYPLKGLPDDIAYEAKGDAFYFIVDEVTSDEGNYCTLEQAQKWATYGCKIIEQDGKPTWVEDPDAHSYSWLTPSEFRTVIARWEAKAKEEDVPMDEIVAYRAVLASLEKFEEFNHESRIVFWFDN